LNGDGFPLPFVTTRKKVIAMVAGGGEFGVTIYFMRRTVAYGRPSDGEACAD
jgi:hypothetical protein